MRRCPATLWLRRHDVRWRVQRDAAGRALAPHTLVWVCERCGRVVGTTTLPERAAERALVAARGAAIRRRAAGRLRLAVRQDGGPRG